MPLVRCTKDGKSGWKWGKNNNSCFTGPEGKKQAIRQGLAITIKESGGDKKKGYKKFQKESSADTNIKEGLQEILADTESSLEDVTMASDILNLSLHQRLNLSVNRRILKKENT